MESSTGIEPVERKRKRTAVASSSSSSFSSSSFLSSRAFDERADEKTKRRISPIQKWRYLVIGKVYRVRAVHDLIVTIKEEEQLSHYGEFEDENEEMRNVWLTPIIYKELMKYADKVNDGSVYLKPLGKRKAKTSQMDYHDFVIVVDDDDYEEAEEN